MLGYLHVLSISVWCRPKQAACGTTWEWRPVFLYSQQSKPDTVCLYSMYSVPQTATIDSLHTVQYRVLSGRSYCSCVALLILALQQLHRWLTGQAWAGNHWTCIVQCNLSPQPFTKSQLYWNKPYSTISGNFRMFCGKFCNPTIKSWSQYLNPVQSNGGFWLFPVNFWQLFDCFQQLLAISGKF